MSLIWKLNINQNRYLEGPDLVHVIHFKPGVCFIPEGGAWLAESLCIGGLGLDSFVCAPAHVCVLIVEAERHLSLGALLELKG